MNNTFPPEILRENISRQAKRLSSHFNLKHSHAQKVLAQALYRCASWQDLTARLKTRQLDKHILMLASLPKSEGAKSYFSEHIGKLSRSISQHMLTNSNLVGLHEAMRYVFGVPGKPVDLLDIIPAIPISGWESLEIGPDPGAVIGTNICLNGVPLRLIGTRVYMPMYMNFGEDVNCPPEMAVPYGESLKVIWTNPNVWAEAAYHYLSSAGDEDEEDDIELTLPDDVLDDAMMSHQKWLSRIAKSWEGEFTYGDNDDNFLPLVIPELGCYLVFAIPLASTPTSCEASNIALDLRGEKDNDSLLISIDGNPLCVEWISVNSLTGEHDGQYPEHFENLKDGLFSHQECDLNIYRSKGKGDSFFFIRPATHFDIDRCVSVDFDPEPGKEAFVLKTDHPELAHLVFTKLAKRDVMIFRSKFRESNYLVELDVSDYEDVHSLSLALDAHGQSWWRGHNLINTSILQKDREKKILYILVEPELLSLSDIFPKKDLIEAIHCGWILHLPEGFSDLLIQPPKRCQTLSSAPDELVKLFNKRIKNISLSDMLSSIKRTRYKRDKS